MQYRIQAVVHSPSLRSRGIDSVTDPAVIARAKRAHRAMVFDRNLDRLVLRRAPRIAQERHWHVSPADTGDHEDLLTAAERHFLLQHTGERNSLEAPPGNRPVPPWSGGQPPSGNLALSVRKDPGALDDEGGVVLRRNVDDEVRPSREVGERVLGHPWVHPVSDGEHDQWRVRTHAVEVRRARGSTAQPDQDQVRCRTGPRRSAVERRAESAPGGQPARSMTRDPRPRPLFLSTPRESQHTPSSRTPLPVRTR